MELLLLCARNDISGSKKDRFIFLMHQDLDWNYIVEKAAIHGLSAFLYYHINLICPERVPEDILNKMQATFNLIFQKNLTLTRELLNIVDYLNINEITVMPYKGPFLALLANQNLSLRQFGDLDLLINKKDFKKVKDLLISLGYFPKFNLHPGIEKTFTKHQNELHFINKNSGRHLDIHWVPLNANFTFPSNTSILWKVKPMETHVEGFNIISPPIEELIILLSIHSASHYWNRLSWLCDISELIGKKNLNWDKLLETAHILGVKRILLVNLLLTNELLGLKLPESIYNIINSEKIVYDIFLEIKNNLINDTYPSGFSEPFFQIKIRDKKWYGFKDSINMLVKPTFEEWEMYHPNKYSYPFCYVLRPFDVLKKYIITPLSIKFTKIYSKKPG